MIFIFDFWKCIKPLFLDNQSFWTNFTFLSIHQTITYISIMKQRLQQQLLLFAYGSYVFKYKKKKNASSLCKFYYIWQRCKKCLFYEQAQIDQSLFDIFSLCYVKNIFRGFSFSLLLQILAHISGQFSHNQNIADL